MWGTEPWGGRVTRTNGAESTSATSECTGSSTDRRRFGVPGVWPYDTCRLSVSQAVLVTSDATRARRSRKLCMVGRPFVCNLS